MEAVEARCVQELIGYYRLSGRTTFTFQNYRGIRLETFYRRKIKFRSSRFISFFLQYRIRMEGARQCDLK